MKSSPTISVIIPTHNRKTSLLKTLDSLEGQTYPMDRLEVIVVDDGSTDDTHTVSSLQFHFPLKYLRQNKTGATTARNCGAAISQAEILVFIDDDVTVSENTLEALAETFSHKARSVVNGRLIQRSNDHASIYSSILSASQDLTTTVQEEEDLCFLNCNTELLACKRNDFLDLGMLQDPTEGKGWPNWDDVDFGYRAYLKGFTLSQCNRAVGEHWDYSVNDWPSACQRWYRASWSAVWLFNKHQALKSIIPMLIDKTPLSWRKDSPLLITRKLARGLFSSRLVLAGMARLVRFLEKNHPSKFVLRRLYFWLQGAYMFHGYREGLRDFKLREAHG